VPKSTQIKVQKMDYPEKAWLLLTDENFYLMSSEEDNKYYAKLEVTRADKKELLIKEVPAEWFKNPRNLVVNLDKEEPSPL
jgi:hypothetical protein